MMGYWSWQRNYSFGAFRSFDWGQFWFMKYLWILMNSI